MKLTSWRLKNPPTNLLNPIGRKLKNSRSNDSEIDSGKGKGRQLQPAREWDRGKVLPGDDHDSEQGRRRGDNHRGTKRNHHSVGENDDVTRDETRRSRHSEALRAPWVEWMSWENCHNVAEMMHDEIEAFVKWASPTKEEDEMRGLVVRLIQQAVTKAYPDAQVLPFGSFATKLYLPLGDIDLVILSDKLENGYKDYVLRDLAHVVKRAGITSNVTIISKARVPIIKFTSTHGSFHVDISIGQIGGLKSVDVVNNFLKTMSLNSTGNALRALVLIAKAFLSQRSMNEVYTGGLGSYSIVCLAISFLQMHPKIRRGEIDPDKNMGVLVVEFFELYGCYFNYDEVGISVREGGMYFRKKQRGWLDYYNQGLLSIEDPVDPTNDISKGSFAFQKVKTTMAGAFGILSTKLYQRAALLRSRRSGSGLRRDDIPPEDVSILSSVLRITQETINHRRLVEEQYHSRALQKILGTKTPPKEPIDVDAYEERKPMVPSQKRVKEVQSVASAWQEAEGELSIKGASARLAAAEEAQLVEDSESDSGRYNIGRQPPRKRQKIGRRSDQHTVFVVDDDDDDSLAEEEEHYASDDISDADSEVEEIKKPASRGEKDRNRSFWLSKAINSGHEST
ncbi:hypothetical protein ONZ45_g5584 [Pleurotus djamor]|nr:hypothetical protein ONZ45_g5584 [Pleurotus djamor]